MNRKLKWPTVLPGKPEDAGMDPLVFDAIESVVAADISFGFPSAQMAVIKDGILVYSKAFGSLNAYNPDGSRNESSTPVTTDTMYDLASNTKMFATNYAIQKLVADGRLNIHAKVTDILGPEFATDTISIHYKGYDNPGLETLKAWKAEITVKDLLRHQAGFPADPQYHNDRFSQVLQRPDAEVRNILFSSSEANERAKEKTLKAVFQTPPMYRPCTKTLYSDVDYMLLGLLVEKITGQPLDRYCMDSFYRPLGLTHTMFNPLENGKSQSDCAATELKGNTRDGAVSFHNIRTETLQGQVHDEKAWYAMGGVSGHAGLFSNAEELAKLAFVMLSGGYGDQTFFSREVIDMFTDSGSAEPSGYGLGWWSNANGQRAEYFGRAASPLAFGHQGWTGTLTMIDPVRDLVAVLLTNKINSPVTDKAADPNRFDGSFYTTGSLRFLPELLSLGINAEDSRQVKNTVALTLADLVSDSVRLAESYGHDPRKLPAEHAAVKGIRAGAEACIRYAEKAKTETARNAAKRAAELLNAGRKQEMGGNSA